MQDLDTRDDVIRVERIESNAAVEGPRVGDYVRFSDGVERRISYVTPAEWLPDVDSVQTSDSGSWYLGDGYVNFSGSLHLGVRRDTLSLMDEVKDGSVWFFHHDYWRANNGVSVEVPCRVYECSEVSTS